MEEAEVGVIFVSLRIRQVARKWNIAILLLHIGEKGLVILNTFNLEIDDITLVEVKFVLTSTSVLLLVNVFLSHVKTSLCVFYTSAR